MRRKRDWSLLRGLLLPAAAVLALVIFTTALNSLESGRAEEDLRQLEDSIRRELRGLLRRRGSLSPNLEYLEERYGVQVDEDRYQVFYDAFAENLMPDVTVLVRTP